jgi:glyoxylase-like metal-dependent hydrolase (beta-lactamase superfamily II)
VRGAVPFADRIDRLLARGLGGDSTPAVPLERAALASATSIIRQYAAEAPGFRETLPDVVFHDRLTLHRGGRTIEVRWFGPANTRGDAVVWLPESRVVATGDLVVAPVPFAFNAYVGGWVGALDSLLALGPAVIVPGHGPLMRDDAYVRRVRAMLTAVNTQTAAAVARGATLDEVRRTVTLDDDRRAIAGNDKWLNVLFRNFFLGPSVTRAYGEAKQAKGR